MNKKVALVFLILVFVLMALPDATAQCSQCKLLAEQSGGAMDDEILGTAGKNNINSAILYIMAVPYLILVFLFRAQIKQLFNRFVTRKS
jgi:hypothetical protein